MSLLRADALSKEFGGVHAVQALQFEIPAQGVYSIIGPNGAGKTTLLNLLTGVYRPSAGRIWFDGRELTGRAPHHYAAAGVGPLQDRDVVHALLAQGARRPEPAEAGADDEAARARHGTTLVSCVGSVDPVGVLRVRASQGAGASTLLAHAFPGSPRNRERSERFCGVDHRATATPRCACNVCAKRAKTFDTRH